MVIFNMEWKKYNEIRLTKHKMDLNIRKMTNHPPSPANIINNIIINITQNVFINITRNIIINITQNIIINITVLHNFFHSQDKTTVCVKAQVSLLQLTLLLLLKKIGNARPGE